MVFLKFKIGFTDLAQIVCFSDSLIDDTSKGFYDIAHKRFPVIEKRVVNSAVEVKTVQRKHGIDKIKQIGVTDI